MVSELINLGADPRDTEDKWALTPLHFSAMYESPECARVLMRYCDPKTRDAEGWTALDKARERNNVELINILSSKNKENKIE